jgi:hypothetical protein
MRIALILVTASFCLFSGWLVCPACGSDANSPAETPQLIAADTVHFDAVGGPSTMVTLGSINRASGFKFEVELTSKGAAINKAALSEFNDRDYKNPRPLVILSPVKLPDGSEVLSMANKEFVFVQQQLLLP